MGLSFRPLRAKANSPDRPGGFGVCDVRVRHVDVILASGCRPMLAGNIQRQHWRI